MLPDTPQRVDSIPENKETSHCPGLFPKTAKNIESRTKEVSSTSGTNAIKNKSREDYRTLGTNPNQLLNIKLRDRGKIVIRNTIFIDGTCSGTFVRTTTV